MKLKKRLYWSSLGYVDIVNNMLLLSVIDLWEQGSGPDDQEQGQQCQGQSRIGGDHGRGKSSGCEWVVQARSQGHGDSMMTKRSNRDHQQQHSRSMSC